MQVNKLCGSKNSPPVQWCTANMSVLSEVLYCVIGRTLQQNTPPLKGGGGGVLDVSLCASISVKLVANLLGR